MAKSKGINNKINFELALIITAVVIGIVGALAYEKNPVVFHQFPIFDFF